MYKRILVPLNGRRQAEQILPHAIELARCTGATIVFIRALQKRVAVMTGAFESGGLGAPSPADVADRLVSDEASEADAYFSVITAALERAGVPFEVVLQEGEPTRSLKTMAAEQHIDLVAMTTSGRSTLSRLFTPSPADALLHDLSVPVLLLRTEK